ncbi:MAG: hypothetical protein GY821_18110 [Gammaproteobacteria bacterium]|nr:hypothetical protein [Gammaproteobacteria bacterium]
MLYFLILIAIALWAHDAPYRVNPFTATLKHISKEWGRSDPASLAKGALMFSSDGIGIFKHYWGLSFWPPGFMMLEGSIVKLFGLNTPIILVLQILSAGLLSLFMLLFYRLLKSWIQPTIALLMPLILFIFSMPRFFLLQPNAIVLGESFAIGFF